MAEGNEIRIRDLAAPELTAIQQKVMSAAGTMSVEFTESSVLEAAETETGLSDFGDDDFRPCKHHDLPSQFLPRSSWTTQVLCALGVRQQVCAGINAPKSVSAG